jgi:PAS domain S-box-containing protein
METPLQILLIEDNPADARLIDIYLREAYDKGYVLTTCDYLRKGLKELTKKTFDIIIIDLTLPDSSGLDTFKSIYEHSPQTPIIVLTGFDDDQVGISAMKLGAQDFLVKGKAKGKTLKRSISYSIERFKLLKELSENTKMLHKKTQDLEREQLKLSEAQKLSHIGSWEWDVEENTISWSDELYRIYGLEPGKDKITVEKINEMMHVADKEHVRKIISESKQTHDSFSFYYRIILPGEEIKTIQTRGEVIVDETGKVVKMVGTDQDVTDRIREEELQKLVLAATQSYNSVIITDITGKIEWVNEGFTKLTGYELNEVINTQSDLFKKRFSTGLTDQAYYFESVIHEKKPITFESKNFTKDRKEYWIITTLTPVIGKSGEVERIIAIDSDITSRKKMEEELMKATRVAEDALMKGNKVLNELIKAKQELEESMKIKEQFLANMSHEIRTPMNAIVGFTNLVLKTELSKEQQQYINAIKVSGENLIVIINDILDFSKMQSGKFVFEQIEFRISKVVSTLTELMHGKAAEKDIKLTKKIDERITDCLIGDPTRLNQILLNLTGNAIKFTEHGEVTIQVDLISEVNDDVELKFSVIDTGIGISPDKLSVIFEGFTQASSETTRKYGGTGLGLTIVKQLVELQGGTISVNSEEGKGSVFSFNLKFKKSIFDCKPKDVVDNDVKMENFEELNILLVEDNVLNQILAKKVLTDWKWNVEVAENGLIALEKVKENNFDLILMDIQMPEMDGYEATRNIRKTYEPPKCNTPIIAMTAHALVGEAEKCIAAGMDEYISKPFDVKVLKSKIYSVLNKNFNYNSTKHES